MENKVILTFLQQQDAIRSSLESIIQKKKMSWNQLAKDIDISPKTLQAFILDEKNLMLKQLSKVEQWVLKNDN